MGGSMIPWFVPAMAKPPGFVRRMSVESGRARWAR
jgi:hypothetical protein